MQEGSVSCELMLNSGKLTVIGKCPVSEVGETFLTRILEEWRVYSGMLNVCSFWCLFWDIPQDASVGLAC
jgi:hypothetical protein